MILSVYFMRIAVQRAFVETLLKHNQYVAVPWRTSKRTIFLLSYMAAVAVTHIFYASSKQ